MSESWDIKKLALDPIWVVREYLLERDVDCSAITYWGNHSKHRWRFESMARECEIHAEFHAFNGLLFYWVDDCKILMKFKKKRQSIFDRGWVVVSFDLYHPDSLQRIHDAYLSYVRVHQHVGKGPWWGGK